MRNYVLRVHTRRRPHHAKVSNECRAEGCQDCGGKITKRGQMGGRPEGGGIQRKDTEGRAGGAGEIQGANKNMNSGMVALAAHCGSSRRGRQHK